METYIVIPAYNEEKRIVNVIKELKNNNYNKIIVVDDGSKDNTAKVAKEKGVKVLSHIINRGQGAALQTGIEYALEKGADYIVTFDADGQHQAKEINKMLKPVLNGEVDITIGSRFLKKSINIPLTRIILLKGSTIIDWIFSGGIKLTDAHNGFRVFSRKAAEKIKISEDGMTHASEIIQQIKQKRISFKEVPVTIKYSKESLKKGQSPLHAINILFRLIFRKLI